MEEVDSFEKLSEDEMAQPLISNGEFALDVVEKVFLRAVFHDDEPEVLFAHRRLHRANLKHPSNAVA